MRLKYFEVAAVNYLARSRKLPWKFFREKERAAVFNYLRTVQPNRILDAGCGSGYYAISINDELKIPVSAIDASPRMISALLDSTGDRSEITAECIPLERFNGKFPAVLLAGVLEFTEDPAAAIRRCAQNLDPNGHLILLVPRQGLPGALYNLSHFFMGCRAKKLKRSALILHARANGLDVIAETLCTPISRCMLFRKSACEEVL